MIGIQIGLLINDLLWSLVLFDQIKKIEWVNKAEAKLEEQKSSRFTSLIDVSYFVLMFHYFKLNKLNFKKLKTHVQTFCFSFSNTHSHTLTLALINLKCNVNIARLSSRFVRARDSTSHLNIARVCNFDL